MIESSLTTAPVAGDLPQVEDYRSLSPTAVFALLAGLASPLVLAHPLMVVIPLAAIALAVVSLRAIAANPRQLAGKFAAVAGLCLATLFMGWGAGGHFVHQAMVRRYAREFADDWLKILATGDKYRAHQLHVAREYRFDPQTPLREFYLGNEPAGTSMRGFFHNNRALDKFLAAGPNPNFRFEEFTLQSRESLGELVVLKYRLLGTEESFPFWITVRRTYKNELHPFDWEIYTVTDEPPFVN